MEEKNFEELYNESLKETKLEKTVTGTVIQVTSKGEIFVDLKYKADGIIPKSEYSDDESKNPKDEFKPGDEITADVLKNNDGQGNVLLSYKRYKTREDKIKEKEMRIKLAKEREEQRIEKEKNLEEFWNNIQIGKSYIGNISKLQSMEYL